MKSTKYVAYYRVSTKRQSLGLEAQQSAIISTIGKANIIAEYTEMESGKITTRIELLKAIDKCKESGATLIIAKLDRLARNVSFLFTLKDSGVDIKALDIPELNTLSLGMFGTIAQHERELISQRTKAALAALKKQGVKLGNGGKGLKDKNVRDKAIKASVQARKVKALSNENNKNASYLIELQLNAGMNYLSIAKFLTDKGIKTSTGKTNWKAEQVKRIANKLL